MKRFNLYSIIYFKPTIKGLESLPKSYKLRINKNGYIAIQLCDFISYFGNKLNFYGSDGFISPLFSDIYINDDELIDTTIEQDIRNRKLKRIIK